MMNMSSTIHKIGLLACVAMVAGNMMGSGIALLPANLGAIGSITIISWLIAMIGALALAYLFAKLGIDNPQEGGLIAYAGEVSPILGYQSGVLYFHANWIGNLAIALTAVSYLSSFFPVLLQPIPSGITTIGIIWLFTLLNLAGAHWISRLVTLGVSLLLIPVVMTSLLGWWQFHPEIFKANWNVSGASHFHAIVSGVLLCIWSFIGVESASVDANLVDHPRRNIPISTLVGTLIAAVVYILSSTAINGMFPAKMIAGSGAPFSLAMDKITGYHIGGMVSAIFAFACLTSLSSWMMLVAQAGARASHDGNLPKIFGELSARNIPVKGMLATSGMMSLVMLFLMFTQSQTSNMFGEIISVAVLLTILPYFYAALNLIRISKQKQRPYLQFFSALIVTVFCFAGLEGASKSVLLATAMVSLGSFLFYVRKDRHIYENQMQEEAILTNKQQEFSE